MLEVLEQQGVTWNYKTPNMGFRGKEIEEWLMAQVGKPGWEENHIDAFAILDDIQQFYGYQRSHFVQTSYIHGLRPKDLEKVDKILGLKSEEKE